MSYRLTLFCYSKYYYINLVMLWLYSHRGLLWDYSQNKMTLFSKIPLLLLFECGTTALSHKILEKTHFCSFFFLKKGMSKTKNLFSLCKWCLFPSHCRLSHRTSYNTHTDMKVSITELFYWNILIYYYAWTDLSDSIQHLDGLGVQPCWKVPTFYP